MKVRLVQDLGDVPASAWDALTGADDPFVEHRFLHALETSGSVGERAGWVPLHVTVWEEPDHRSNDAPPIGEGGGEGVPTGERLVAALPLYAKTHSYGEYIFDWAWADAAMRLGLRYYPKLVSMVPVTPATGRRLLLHPGLVEERRRRALAVLMEGAFAAAEATESSSVHLLFLRDEEAADLGFDERLVRRLTHQFHWTNEGYESFDDFVGRFRSSMRKQVRKERRRVAESPLTISVRTGSELDEREWSALYRFYKDTCRRKGSYPYLTKRFFSEVRDRLPERVVAAFAHDQSGEAVAGSLNFEKGAVLYGRYWGCLEEYDMLHFELCYYQLIERAIDRGMARFEAGAQGTHKLRRGLMPTPIHSLHWVRDPVLAEAVRDFLPREAASVRRQMEELADHGPFRRESAER